MSLTVLDAIAARHSVRSYDGRPVAEGDLRELLEAARNAPSSLNSQPWRFKVVTDRADIEWLATKEATRKQGWLATTGAVIICLADLSGYVRDSQAAAFFYRDNDIIQGETMDGIDAYVAREAAATDAAKFGAAAMNVGIALSFMMLRAVDLGLGSCWVGMVSEDAVKARFGIDPALRMVALMAVGHPAEAEVYPRQRKSLDDIVLS